MLTPSSASRSDIAVLGGAYFAFFAIVGLMVPYLSVYLDRLGYDSKSIGAALSSVAIMRIIAPSLWSALADKTGQHILIARLGALLAFLSLMLLFWVETRPIRLVVLSAFNFFWTAILPQVEVTSLRRLAATDGLYAKVRSAGSLGFIVIATFAGIFIAEYGPNAFVVIGLLLSASLLATLMKIEPVPLTAATEHLSEGREGFFNWALVGLIGCCFLVQTSHGAYYTFFILHMNALGYSAFAAGCLSGVGVISEIILFWYIGRWFRHSSVLAIFRLALILTVIRWLMMAWFADVAPLLILSLVLHAASFGMVHSCAMRWLHDRVQREHQGKAQALYSGFGFGAGSVVGAAVAGGLWQQGQGATQSYLACALIAALALLVYYFTLHHSAKS